MSTNYYYVEQCAECGHRDVIHIGKSSGGWCFALHVYPDRDLNNLSQWTLAMIEGGGFIEDEYGDRITIEDMIEVITIRGGTNDVRVPAPEGYSSWGQFLVSNQAEMGPNGLLRYKVGRLCIEHGVGTWDHLVGDFS